MANSKEVPGKVKDKMTIDPKISSGCVSEGNEITVSKRHLYLHVHCTIIYNSQGMETTEVSINR